MPDKKKKREEETETPTDKEGAAAAKEEPKKGKKEKKEKDVEYVPRKTALGDTATIKRLMDDAVVNVVIGYPVDGSENAGYDEDTAMSNLKLVVGFAAVGASLVSHVYPAPFPRNWWVLFWCCAFYFALSGVLQLLLSFVELESILIVRGKLQPNSTKRGPALNFSSHFPRFQEMYTLGVVPMRGGALSLASAPRFRPDLPNGNTEPCCLQRSWSVAKYFDEEGNFAMEAFEKEVQTYMSDHERLVAADGASSKKTQ